jgi:hypothetical protein
MAEPWDWNGHSESSPAPAGAGSGSALSMERFTGNLMSPLAGLEDIEGS